MATGSFDYSPPSGDLGGFAAQILVCRYEPEADEGQRYTFLPNVRCEQIQTKEGAEPPTAQFSYILDDSGSLDWPSRIEQLWPLDSPANPYKVRCGDRLTCLRIDPEGNYRVIWDGFAQLPQADISPRDEAATFVGVDASIRLWDVVVTGRWQRDGTSPSTPGNPYQTSLPTLFNPDDLPNCTPDDADEEDDDSGAEWPVFLEPKLGKVAGETVQTYWDLSKFARYLLWYYNDEEHVENPDFGVLDALLSCRSPKKGSTFYDPNDASTYDESPIVLREFDATNRPMMEVLDQQLRYAGFRMRPICEGTPAGGSGGVIVEEPRHVIEIYRFDASGASPKEVSLAAVGGDLDPGTSNLSAFTAAADFHAVANQWTVESRPVAYEVGVLLAPGFTPAAGDESNANRKKWLRSNQDTATKGDREKYRLWIADECGEGFWDLKAKSWKTGVLFPFRDVFDPDGKLPDDDPGFVARYRPGKNALFSNDPSGKPYRAQLLLSRDYDPGSSLAPPCTWDGTGTWQTIDGGWRLLKDRLGIFIDIENPMEWDVGKPDSDPAQEPSGVLDAVTSIANPGTAQRQKPFYLKLVAVIDGDSMIDATAYSRPASPYPFTVARQVDAKDHFAKKVIDGSSPFNPGDKPVVAQDDTDKATTYAEQMRAAHEFPPIAATATIPWFTAAYAVGDRISRIGGRAISLRSNAGTEQGEAPSYPYIVAISWDFGADEKTVLQLSDRRNEPSPFEGGRHFGGRSRG